MLTLEEEAALEPIVGAFCFSRTFSALLVLTLEPEAALVEVLEETLCTFAGVVLDGLTTLFDVEEDCPLTGLTFPDPGL